MVLEITKLVRKPHEHVMLTVTILI